MGIQVTIYNDDKANRLFQVLRINTRTGDAFDRKVIKPSEESGPECFEISKDEILIVTPADPE